MISKPFGLLESRAEIPCAGPVLKVVRHLLGSEPGSRLYRDHVTLRWGPVAETYRRQGLTYLADQLEQLRQELDSSATVYAQILRDRQLSDARIQAMQQQANTEMFQMRQRSIDYTRQAYAESNRRFMETTFGHTAGFNNYGGGAFCPRCGRPVYGYHGGTCGCCY